MKATCLILLGLWMKTVIRQAMPRNHGLFQGVYVFFLVLSGWRGGEWDVPSASGFEWYVIERASI